MEKTPRDKPIDKMFWDGWLEPLVVPTRWYILRLSLYRDPVWPYVLEVSYTERSFGRHLCVYLLESSQVESIPLNCVSWYSV